METKTMTLKIEIPIKKIKRDKDGLPKLGQMLSMSYDVKGMMRLIESQVSQKSYNHENAKLLLDEYAKFKIMDMLKIKTYPLEK